MPGVSSGSNVHGCTSLAASFNHIIEQILYITCGAGDVIYKTYQVLILMRSKQRINISNILYSQMQQVLWEKIKRW